MYKLKEKYKEVQYVKRTVTDEEYEEMKTMISDEVEMYEYAEDDVENTDLNVDTTYSH